VIIDYICTMKKIANIEVIVDGINSYATEEICLSVVNAFVEKYPKFNYERLIISNRNACDFQMYRQSFYFTRTKIIKKIPLKFGKLFVISSLKSDFKDLIDNGSTVQHIKDLSKYHALFEVISPTSPTQQKSAQKRQ
jgi:hypothetical protein